MHLILNVLTTLILVFSLTSSADKYSEVKITVIPVAGDVYLLKGAGGNIGVLATADGLIMVDDQFLPLAEKITQAMKAINGQSLKYIINTHFHGDHTGSNSYFSHQAPIFAHENVRQRLAQNKKLNPAALPVITYQDGIKIYLANEEVQLSHFPNGHTDGDTVVYFKKANVLHMGDLFFAGAFPYIDVKRGGSVQGYLRNVKQIISTINDEVVIIPGHGHLANNATLVAFAKMIEESINLVTNALNKGKSSQEIIAMGLPKKYLSFGDGYINEERWLTTLITALTP